MSEQTEEEICNEPGDNVSLDQYKELCIDGRHLDNKLWLIPTAAFTITILAIKTTFETKIATAQVILSLLNLIVFISFTIQFLKYRAYQLSNQRAIKRIQCRLRNFVEVSQYAGLKETGEDDKWFIKAVTRFSAANFMANIMLITIIVDSGIVIWSILKLVKSTIFCV